MWCIERGMEVLGCGPGIAKYPIANRLPKNTQTYRCPTADSLSRLQPLVLRSWPSIQAQYFALGRKTH